MADDDEFTGLVFLCEDPVPADLAIVFGAASELEMEHRIRRGVELYHDGYVPKLLVSGGGVLGRAYPEARTMAQIARDLGVPDSDLLVEDNSSNTFENVRSSLMVVQAAGLLDKLSTVILVSSEWHMRRVLYTARTYFPDSIRMVCCPTREGCNRNNWTESEACRKAVTDDFLAMIERNGLQFGGGGRYEWSGVVQGPWRKTVTENDRVIVLAWLQQRTAIIQCSAGPLNDAWHGYN